MEAKAYNGLMDFLCNTLTPSELKRLGEQLVNHAKMKEEEEEQIPAHYSDARGFLFFMTILN